MASEKTFEYLKTGQKKRDAETAYQIEDAINNLDRKITDYLVEVSRSYRVARESESSRYINGYCP